MLIDIVRSLSIDDTTEQTRIVEGITAIYQVVNQVKEALKNKMRSLMTAKAAQFNAQILLLGRRRPIIWTCPTRRRSAMSTLTTSSINLRISVETLRISRNTSSSSTKNVVSWGG